MSDQMRDKEVQRRNNEVSQRKWDLRFLGLAREISTWSKDPSSGVGSVIANGDRRIISLGYNGFPLNIIDDPSRYIDRDLKYQLVIHAEMNALLFARGYTKGCTIYTYPFPACVRCGVHIIQAQIKRVVSLDLDDDTRTRWGTDMELANDIMKEAGLEISIYPRNTI